MIELKSLDPNGSKNVSGQSSRLAVKRGERRRKKVVNKDETETSRWGELEKLAAEKEAERESKKMVEVSEAAARWLEIREALRKEKEHRLEMKRRIEMEEINNPKVLLPPQPPPDPKKRRKRGTGGGGGASASRSAILGGSSSNGNTHSHQPFNLQYPAPTPPPQTIETTSTTIGSLFHQSSQVTSHKNDKPPQTLQLFPETPTPDPLHRLSSSTTAAVAVTKINGDIFTGSVN